MTTPLTALTVPRESRELVRLVVTDIDANTVLTDYQVALTEGYSNRPTSFTPPQVAGTHRGYLMPGTLPPGVYTLWVKVVDVPETLVRPYARVTVT